MVRLASGMWLSNFRGIDEDKRFLDVRRDLLEKAEIGIVQLLVNWPNEYYDPNGVLMMPSSHGCADNALEEDFTYVVHAQHEGQGVDLGETLDERKPRERHSWFWIDSTWEQHNKGALKTTLEVYKKFSKAGKIAVPVVVMHPGFLEHRDSSKKKLVDFLSEPESDVFGLETVPAPAVNAGYDLHDGKLEFIYWAMGGTPKDMGTLIKEAGMRHRPVLDYTHLNVTSNNMDHFKSPFKGFFFENEVVRGYEELIVAYEDLDPWNFVHISGYTDRSYDEHNGFIPGETEDGESCPIAPDWFKEDVKDSIKKLEEKHGEVTVALELRYGDLDGSLRQVEAFRSWLD